MRRQKWQKFIFLMVYLLFGWSSLAMAAPQNNEVKLETEEVRSAVYVKFYIGGKEPLQNVRLFAWRQGFDQPIQEAYTDHSGIAVFDALDDGVYFFGGDITQAGKHVSSREKLLSASGVRHYYISTAAKVQRGESLTLIVDPSAYIEVVDFFGGSLDRIRIRRPTEGLELVIEPAHKAKQLKLYLPLRRNYAINTYRSKDVFSSKFYAGKGLRCAIW